MNRRGDSKMMVAYAIGAKREKDGKSSWTRVGVAWMNDDGSVKVKLDALPVTGELFIKVDTPRDDRRQNQSYNQEDDDQSVNRRW